VSSALFETGVYLVGQHMAQKAVTGQAAQPMPVRLSAWAIYDIFQTRDSEQVFLGIVSDALWQKFCAVFELAALANDPRYGTNNQRVQARAELLPQVRAVLAGYSKDELLAKLEPTGLPFAPIGKPEDLFADPHLLASGGLSPVKLTGGEETQLPVLPIEIGQRRSTASGQLARPGEHTVEVLRAAGVEPTDLDILMRNGVIAMS
jgi:crotonobetainyl-CoA:carnitine CoA-transferase CaiB-like acyl-CoA transferase